MEAQKHLAQKTTTLNKQEQTQQITLFYKYLKPSATSLLLFDEKTKKYQPEQLIFTPTLEEFVQRTIENNERGDCFACRNRFHHRRVSKNVTFLKTWVIDIDNDDNQIKSKKFEELCKRYNIYIEAKSASRGVGGYHYYIPYKPTYVDDNNRDKIIQVGKNFRDWLVEENNLDIDIKIFDLPRLIRIFGSYNHKRKSFCRLIYLHLANDEQINHNTKFINGLEEKKYPDLPTPSSIVTSCPLVEYVRKNQLQKDNTEKNDKLLKNVAIFLFNLLGEEGLQIGIEITKLQNHNPSAFEGWFNKARNGELPHFSCGELNLWLKKYYPELLPQTCSRCRLLNKNKVEYLDSNVSFFDLKKQAREKQKLLINKEQFIKGVVAPTANPYKQEIVIFKVYEKENDEDIINPQRLVIFFDEKAPKGVAWREINSLSVDFYVYDLIEGDYNHLLLSEKQLDYGEYYIEGSSVKLTDKMLIGNYGTASTRRKIILLNSAKSLISQIKSHKELFELIKNWSRKKLIDYLFSYKDEIDKITYIYRQPENIENLILSFLLSSKFEFPLHLCLYGKQDSGKSTIMKCLFNKFNEPYQLVDGSNTTLKGLVPSFAHSSPQLGVLLESKRVCMIDEFFRVIKGEEDRDRLSVLNNFLLHTKYTSRTGKGSIDCKMRSKLLTVTNPLYGCNFEETMQCLPPSTIDRILIWKQYKSHYNWVRKGDNKFEGETEINKYLFLSVYDYLNSFKSEFDKSKVFLIVDEVKAKCPNYMLNLYETRYGTHHSLCLMDGIVKTRCLLEGDASFKTNEKDYKEFKKLWEDLVLGWYDSLNKDVAEKLLTDEQKAFMSLIENNDIWDYQLEKKCEEQNIEYKHNYKRLLDLKLIEVKNRKIKGIEKQELNLFEEGEE